MKRKLLGIVPLVTAFMFMLTACGAPAAPDTPPGVTPPAGGTTQTELMVLTPSLAVSFDPIQSNDSASAEFARLIYSTLVLMDYDTFEVLPGLATSWDLPDPQTVNMQIRSGVTFHNGDPLTAHDVAFSLERAGASVQMAPILGMIDTVVAHDNYNVTIHLDIPFVPILRHLSHPAAAILPMNYLLEVGEDEFANAPIGSGAFMFDHLVIGDQQVKVRFDNYWGNVSQLERITFRVVPDPSTRLIEVSTGTADIAMGLAPGDLAGAEADPNVTVMRRPNLGTDFIWMNTQRPYLNNPLVRQAINYAFDTQAAIDVVWMGAGAIAHSPVMPIVWGFVEQPPFETNLDRARELLAEAGYPDGFSTSIWWNAPNVQRQQVSEMMQFTLAQIGIDLSIETMEWATYLERSDVGEHDMMIIGWTTVTADIDYALFPLLHSSNYGPPGNRGFWSTPELDALLEAGRAETDDAARMEIYAEAQAIIRAEAPMLVLRQGEILMAVNPNLRGLELNPNLSHNHATIWFE
ncbi:MAG: ABC transporter substrate-binding protein [Defluviitaleaceae bacterium]|nr:ABC transporter substrate-binding protein [Defluviitaleaceae bacterium]